MRAQEADSGELQVTVDQSALLWASEVWNAPSFCGWLETPSAAASRRQRSEAEAAQEQSNSWSRGEAAGSLPF